MTDSSNTPQRLVDLSVRVALAVASYLIVAKLNSIDAKLEKLDAFNYGHESRLATVEARVESAERRLSQMEKPHVAFPATK